MNFPAGGILRSMRPDGRSWRDSALGVDRRGQPEAC